MVGRPGKIQAVFNAGELGPRFDQRVGLKYHAAGLKHADRIELLPQGGFSVAPGTRIIGDTADTADRLIAFAALNGNVYDLAFNAAQVEVWGETSKLHQFNHVYSADEVRQLNFDQQLDTLLLFHQDHAPWRALHGAPATWVTGNAPLTDIPTYNYGAVYTNGVASEFILDFIGFHEGNAPYWDNLVFTLKVNGQETSGLRGTSTAPTTGQTPNMTAIAADVQAALLALPNVNPGVTVTVESAVSPFRLRVVFAGAGNLGDLWSLSGAVINKADAALLATQDVVGVEPGEAIISALRGWPRCGRFYQQRLILGGFKSLPNAWMASRSGFFFDFDQRLKEANGSFVIPLDIPGGERIEQIVNNQFLLVMTSEKNYWVAGSTQGLSKTAPPKHVPATDHGVESFVPVVDNEGAAVYVHRSGDFVGEMRYTDIDGNYVATDLTLLAYHLISDAKDVAIRRKDDQQSANQLAAINQDGKVNVGYLLREQELTGFTRYSMEGTARAVAVNNRNDMTLIMERQRGTTKKRTIERMEKGQLLDGAITKTYAVPTCEIHGLHALEGAEVWAIADNHVLGPFTVVAGQISLDPVMARTVTVGRWVPPRAETLPLSRMIGPELWQQKKARIHSVQLFLENTTSIAVSANGGKVYDINLRRYGHVPDVPELEAGFTGVHKVRGFSGYVDEPTLVITQLRPGRMTVKSIVVEMAL